LAGNDEGKAGERAGMPTRGRPVLPEQPPDQTQPVPPPELEWPELKLDYQKIGLAIVVLLVLVVGAYLWLRRKRQDEKTDREHDQDNAKLSPDQVRRAINRFRQQCQELLDTPIRDDSYTREKVIELYNSLLVHFAECGVGKPPYFTPDEYFSRESSGRPTLREELSHVTTTFNRALYGLIAPPPDEFRRYISNVARLGGFVTLY